MLTLRADCRVLPFLVREFDDCAAGGALSVTRGLSVAELVALEREPITNRPPQFQKRLILATPCRVILREHTKKHNHHDNRRNRGHNNRSGEKSYYCKYKPKIKQPMVELINSVPSVHKSNEPIFKTLQDLASF